MKENAVKKRERNYARGPYRTSIKPPRERVPFPLLAWLVFRWLPEQFDYEEDDSELMAAMLAVPTTFIVFYLFTSGLLEYGWRLLVLTVVAVVVLSALFWAIRGLVRACAALKRGAERRIRRWEQDID
jgi:hypothetical protein